MAFVMPPVNVPVLVPPLPLKPPDPVIPESPDPISQVPKFPLGVIRLSLEEISADAPVPTLESLERVPLSTDSSVVEQNPVVFGTALPWATRFRSSLRNLKKETTPSFLDDGTPIVSAPDSVLLGASVLWKGHLIAHWYGKPPPVSRILSDLNPIWGTQGRISVRHLSDSSSLIFIPSEATRARGRR
ncbi:unnamed protein product [Arabis nemorensis]|uniref:DUF4283 domain-containing protein n=1 Tax=Arabis nemorensis TaxID=586526 RepID=A0A565AW27_9BRAS|nr:unnamed protein product [Arabis nemorensis]